MEDSSELIEILFLSLGGALILLIVVFSAFYALNVSRKRIVSAEKEKARILIEEKQKMLEASIQGGERERKKIAEELHDHINAQLTVVRMSLVREEGENISNAVESIDHTIQELRGISRELMPPVLERFGLLDALDDLFDKVEKAGELRIDFNAPEEWEYKDIDRDLALYRIVQEFIQNTIKYAEASKLDISVQADGHHIYMNLRDNGVGFDMNQVESGLGTRNVNSRAEYLGGTANLSSSPGKGVSLSVTVPLNT